VSPQCYTKVTHNVRVEAISLPVAALRGAEERKNFDPATARLDEGSTVIPHWHFLTFL
jgi:hypothetical protein